VILRLLVTWFKQLGKRPASVASLGKVLLAGIPASERRKILARKLDAVTPRTVTDPAALERELREAQRSGYALDRQEITRGIMCVAAPIRSGDGSTVGAISVAFPASIDEERGIESEILAVTRCAAAVTAELQGTANQESEDLGAVRKRGPRRRARE